MISVVVIRHAKERRSKCSLTPLEGRADFRFFKAGGEFRFDGTGYVTLAVDAPVLTAADNGPLLILDSTWRLLPDLERCVTGEVVKRSLPGGIETAYPRRSKICEDPVAGLASIEAIYAAKRIMGEEDATLLNGYYWKDAFLAQFE